MYCASPQKEHTNERWPFGKRGGYRAFLEVELVLGENRGPETISQENS